MGKIPSPCISVCTMDEDTGYCFGCFRTLEEIAKWEKYSDTEKSEVLKKLDERKVNNKDSC
jgi:predicted Fe-S protein YdhL (DUF1289 family)